MLDEPVCQIECGERGPPRDSEERSERGSGLFDNEAARAGRHEDKISPEGLDGEAKRRERVDCELLREDMIQL